MIRAHLSSAAEPVKVLDVLENESVLPAVRGTLPVRFPNIIICYFLIKYCEMGALRPTHTCAFQKHVFPSAAAKRKETFPP